MRDYIGRFAPSPTGPLHAGSLVAAMASYLDARAQGGQWLVRIEDIDEARTVPGAAEAILDSLKVLGMQWDAEPVWQTARKDLYAAAFRQLGNATYPCGCTRREIADSHCSVTTDGSPVYPGFCRHGIADGKPARSWRVRVPERDEADDSICFTDRWLGKIERSLAHDAGDFVLRRADGYWAYQLAVVVDDHAQGMTDVVRGADLLDSTARQIYLQRLLGYPTPRYLHVPVVSNHVGEKLSKQTGALALDLAPPLLSLKQAAEFLQLELGEVASVGEFWRSAVAAWARRHVCATNA
jgi:glutamyl-Q tRNA(Asp) synthetase